MEKVVYHHLIDIYQRKVYPAEICYAGGRIISITTTDKPCKNFILPGFVDAHVHIESSMLIPSEFARLAVRHGTVATVSDPHEIANVCGVKGVEFMLKNAAKTPLKIHFGAPSCVPATNFETSGATLEVQDVKNLLERNDIYYLSEMMNYPGVLQKDKDIIGKIAAAKKAGKPVDGHAPSLRGDTARIYIEAGISTDHECLCKDEALDKLLYGMKILIREGSAAKNFEALAELIHDYEDELMFCSDDKHPDDLELHHINNHVKRALALGMDIFKVLKIACVNPVKHYKLPVGLLRPGDPADFIVIDNIADFNILKTVIDGQEVFSKGITKFKSIKEKPINNFNCEPKTELDFEIFPSPIPEKIRIIEALDGQLITKTTWLQPKVRDGNLVTDINQDILKIVVVNRYANEPVSKAFIRNFGLRHGAIASTVAHDSHNIICVGVDDKSICTAVNTLIEAKGGIVVVADGEVNLLPLNVAGIMSTENAEFVAKRYSQLDRAAKNLGCKLSAPFMTLSFMALLVIPQLKISDKGLFDGEEFRFVGLN